MAKPKFYANKESKDIITVMGTLSQTLPDERPITSIIMVENSSKCPSGYYPILKTYDEDSDADLWRSSGIFGKRTCRYLCLSKSEDSSAFKLTNIQIIGASDVPPAGFSIVSMTSDTNRQAWRRRQLCYMMTNGTPSKDQAFITDVIICSRLKKAPDGFKYAGDINGLLICYKTNTERSMKSPFKYPNIESEVGNYENVLNKNIPNKRAPPERPPKMTALVAELNNLNIHKNETNSQANLSPSGDYEVLDKSYNLQPTRPAPAAPGHPPIPPRAHRQTSMYNAQTLSNYNALEGATFCINPKLKGFARLDTTSLPVIKKKTLSELDSQYSYNFRIERQT